eukprot:Selendium_serpulae@DN5063_c2_g1_i1.p1
MNESFICQKNCEGESYRTLTKLRKTETKKNHSSHLLLPPPPLRTVSSSVSQSSVDHRGPGTGAINRNRSDSVSKAHHIIIMIIIIIIHRLTSHHRILALSADTNQSAKTNTRQPLDPLTDRLSY